MYNSVYGQVGFKIRAIRDQLGLSQEEFSNEFQIPRHDLERFERGVELPSLTVLAYLSAISNDPNRVLEAVRARKIFDLTIEEHQSFSDLSLKRFQDEIAHEGGRDPNDKILWTSSNEGRLPEDVYKVRYPPKSAVQPCLVKCLYCKLLIDVPFQVFALHDADNASIFDVDCPHCWQCNPFVSRPTVQKLVRFRKKCREWIDPPVAKPGRVTPSLRFKVLERDNFRCCYCGATPQQSALHVDHKVPINEGGSNAPENLVAACTDCNLGKGNQSIHHEY